MEHEMNVVIDQEVKKKEEEEEEETKEIENVVDDDEIEFDFGFGSDFEFPPLVFADVVFFEWKYLRIFPMAMPPTSSDEIVEEEITEPRVHSRRRQTVPLWEFLVDERIEELESEVVAVSEVEASETEEEEALSDVKGKRWRFKGFFSRGRSSSSSRSSDVSEGSCCSSSGEAWAAEKLVAEEAREKKGKGKKKEMKRQRRMSFG